MAIKIMIQGTNSNVGKSVFAAALCRIFKQDGYKVTPFKSQNMALNSYVTEEGLEMGRAQVMQAEAAGIKPSAKMNPILLKPTGDMGSQVIINGKVLGNLSAKEYYRRKKEFIPAVMEAYNELDKEYDIIVIEGAGSPAEINLKKDDIVNMGLAKMINAPVLLVGDIDKGGVFAALAGTMLLLEKEETDLIKGLVINKFRGDIDLLKPGLKMIEDRLNRPVIGVVPYMKIELAEEDSLSEKLNKKSVTGLIDIAVVRLPRISNFTDFDNLNKTQNISVRYVETAAEMSTPDMIFIPGSKNTIEDLRWLRETGMENLIKKHADSNTIIFGICGGFQMMGQSIDDPDNMEGGGNIRGLGLVPMVTTFNKEKVQKQVEGYFNSDLQGELEGLSGKRILGYEIHMGDSNFEQNNNTLQTLTHQATTCKSGYGSGNIYGSYVHGIFDSFDTLEALRGCLAKRKGINLNSIADTGENKTLDSQYDSLAYIVRENIDMEYIYEVMRKGG